MFDSLLKPEHLVLLGLLFVIPAWQIVKKAGFSPWFALLILVPLLGLIGFWFFAFIQWPVSSLGKEQSASGPSPGTGPAQQG